MPWMTSPSTDVVLPGALRCSARAADTATVATEPLPDLALLAAQLAHLEHRRLDLLRQHDKLTERMLTFPNDFGLAWARSLAAEIEAMTARIDDLEAELLPYRA